MPFDLTIPANPVALPPGYRLVENTIRTANRDHRLDCGCRVQSGMTYHLVKFAYNNQLVHFKRHVFGCLEGPNFAPHLRFEH